MKQILALLFLINLTVSCDQNARVNVVGEWKIIEVVSEDFYLNTQTDSVSISKYFKEAFSDSLEVNNIIKVAKITYKNNFMEFHESGIFTQNSDSELRTKGTYELKPSIGKINVLLEENVDWEMDYKIVDSQLHLTSTLYGEQSKFVLERVKK